MTTNRVGYAIGLAVAVAIGLAAGYLTRPTVAALPAGATPAVCVEALDYAAEGFTNNADAMDAARRVVDAATRGDRDGVRDGTADLDDANGRLEGIVDDARRTARACRAGAR